MKKFRIGFEDKQGNRLESLPFEARNRMQALALFWERQLVLVEQKIAPEVWPVRNIYSIREV